MTQPNSSIYSIKYFHLKIMIFVFQIQQHCHRHQHIPLKIYFKKLGHLKIYVKKFRLWRSLFFVELRQLVRRLKWATI